MTNLKPYQHQLIESALSNEVLRFGRFTLKSDRVSPYFFNAGLFNTGQSIAEIGECYAECILDHELEFDVMFGPAYKGISLVTSTAIALAKRTGKAVPFCFDRKEVKQHGEGGVLIGAPMQGKVLVLDDVISKGVSIRYSAKLIAEAGAELAGVLIAIDRQERGEGKLAACQEVAETFNTTVTSIVNLETLIAYAKDSEELAEHQQALMAYQEQYGA